jgi:DNA-binding MarR family transcriptional regulator
MRRTSTRIAAAAGCRDSAYRLDDQVGFLLRRAYQRASANLVARIGAYAITPAQFATLARLYEQGKVSQNRLGRLVAMEPANIRDVVLRLKKRRLVATERDPGDGRLILIGLTSAGVALIRVLVAVEAECTSKTLAPLRANERKLLHDLLRRLAGE